MTGKLARGMLGRFALGRGADTAPVNTAARVSQVAIEALQLLTPPARMSQVAVEVFYLPRTERFWVVMV